MNSRDWMSEENEMALEVSNVDDKVLGLPKLAPPKNNGGSALSYPILTEDIGYPPPPAAGSGSTSGSNGSNQKYSLGPTVNKALQEVLGWKIKSDDATGFLGALNQSFQLKMSEGAVVSTWTPRSYVVQTDLSGGVTGAQASIFTMAKTLSDQLLPLVDGLYALDPASDTEAVEALKQLVRSQVTNLTNEFGYLGGPRVMRVQKYLEMLFGITLTLVPDARPISVNIVGQNPPPGSPLLKVFKSRTRSKSADERLAGSRRDPWPDGYWRSPDTVLGSLGDLRDELGLSENIKPTYINTIADEQNVTNFRIIIDYANSLLNGWQNSVRFFAGRNSHFLGTQLVIISRQLGVVSETVEEVRFVLDSVFIGPAQRETLQIDFAETDVTQLSPIHLEDMLHWMQDFVGAEAQNVIQTGGKLGLGEDFIAMIKQLYHQAYGLYQFAQGGTVPAMTTARVQQSLYKLALQLQDLHNMAQPVSVAYIRRRA
jgi:hypothetical protein